MTSRIAYSTANEYIESWEKKIAELNSRGKKKLILFSIPFPNIIIPVEVENYFRNNSEYHGIKFRKCRRGLWDIIIEWSDLGDLYNEEEN